MKTEAELDEKSYPFRKVLGEWARERGLGFGGGWHQIPKMWMYDLYGVQEMIRVEIEEDGSCARVFCSNVEVGSTAKPLGLRRLLTVVYEKRAQVWSEK